MTAPGTLVLPLAGFLAEPAGVLRRIDLAEITIVLDDDLVLARPVSGTLEISRTNRGVFLDGLVTTGLNLECSRCLEPTTVDLVARIREEVLLSVDLATGRALDPSQEPDVARLSDAAGRRLGYSATETNGHGRKESNPLGLFWRQAAHQGARPCQLMTRQRQR